MHRYGQLCVCDAVHSALAGVQKIACVEKKRDGDHVFVESSHPLLVSDEDILHYYPLAKTLKSGGDRVSL
uniref:Uncharacterized protein n=1 Tax=Oryza sativa subsp. japonica TaxID=39947 RepID=Q6EN38_ORYSJ|nr:hypothetical protein [Oryza sativa Japonica Group]BAD29697.1 hypothetical protein [Oryza sativa Japonica Group]